MVCFGIVEVCDISHICTDIIIVGENGYDRANFLSVIILLIYELAEFDHMSTRKY